MYRESLSPSFCTPTIWCQGCRGRLPHRDPQAVFEGLQPTCVGVGIDGELVGGRVKGQVVFGEGVRCSQLFSRLSEAF
jgi:hypothetical protein